MLSPSPLRINGTVSSQNLALFRFLFAPDLYNEDTPAEQGLGAKGTGTRKGPPYAGAAKEVAASTSQLIYSSSSAPPSRIPATGTIPDTPFRYTREKEAEIWGNALQSKYPLAYRLFEPSECPKIIEGADITRFVSEHPDRMTTAGRKATRLWVCQATAKWGKDGSVSYTPDPCGTACTSWDICVRHISTRHLGKARGLTALQ
jgi:hypothetical protein